MSLTPDDLHDLRIPVEVAVSPDGTQVAIVVVESDPTEDEYRRSLFVVPTVGSRDPHRLTRASDASSPKWGPDGDRLAFLAARDRDVSLIVGTADETDEEIDSQDPGDEPMTQVWVSDLARGGDARQVTAFDEGVREFDWSPDGDQFVVSARDPTEEQREYLDGIRDGNAPYELTRLQHKQDGAGYLDDVRSYLFVIDSEAQGTSRDGAMRLEDTAGRGAREPFLGLQPSWGPSGRIALLRTTAMTRTRPISSMSILLLRMDLIDEC